MVAGSGDWSPIEGVGRKRHPTNLKSESSFISNFTEQALGCNFKVRCLGY